MKSILKGNSYTDSIWLAVGVVGGILFWLESKYWQAGVFLVLALLYFFKIIKEIFDKRNSSNRNNN